MWRAQHSELFDAVLASKDRVAACAGEMLFGRPEEGADITRRSAFRWFFTCFLMVFHHFSMVSGGLLQVLAAAQGARRLAGARFNFLEAKGRQVESGGLDQRPQRDELVEEAPRGLVNAFSCSFAAVLMVSDGF